MIDLRGKEGGGGGRSSHVTAATMGRGVHRQIDLVLQYVESHGGTLKRLYMEDGVSAYKRKKVRLDDGTVALRVVRPEFEQALRDLRNGVVDFLVWEELDRLVRDIRQGEDVIEAVILTGRPIIDISGEMDLSTTTGQTEFRNRVAAAHRESTRKAERMRRARMHAAGRGETWGGQRPFGWHEQDRVGKTQAIREDEAALIRDAVEMLLTPGNGVTHTGIAHMWNEMGVLTPRGSAWIPRVIRTMLMSPRMAGWSISDKGIAVDLSGAQVKSTVYEGLIDNDTWLALCDKLMEDPQAGKSLNGTGAKYLLSGFAQHEKCGGIMYGNRFPTASNPDGHRYTCSNPIEGVRCGSGSIDGPRTDELVRDYLFNLAADEQVLRSDIGPFPREAELARVRADREALFDAVEAGEADAADAARMALPLQRRIKELLAAKTAHGATARAAGVGAVRLQEEWDTLPTLKRRAYVFQMLETVLIRSQRRPARLGFDKWRVKPIEHRR
jgi:site-specific DNA recombinase